MKTKFSDKLTCVLFCGFVGVMFLLFLLLPRDDFSEKEKRYLQESPTLSWEALSSGQYGEDVESYLADSVPGRDFFVGLNAYYDLLSGRQITKDYYLAAGDRIVQSPVQWDAQAAEKNMAKINAFAQNLEGMDVDLMIVPSAGYCVEEQIYGVADAYADDQIIRDIYAMAQSGLNTVSLTEIFRNAPSSEKLYYRTDHHWTSLGAYTAYKTYMTQLGREFPAEDAFQISTCGGFYGSTYSGSGLWLTESEDVELWDTGNEFIVTNAESTDTHNGLFYEERLQELDKYTVYLDGNHSLVRIQNPAAAGKGKLLVIRDSYANCLGTFLANSYEEVVLVDLRYYKKPVSQLLEEEGFSNVLVCYSIANFMTDTNISWLR